MDYKGIVPARHIGVPFRATGIREFAEVPTEKKPQPKAQTETPTATPKKASKRRKKGDA